MRRFLLVTLACSAAMFGQTPPASEVAGVGTFIHVVANLDKTIEFYRDGLGLEMTGAPGPRAFSTNAVIEGLYDAKGSQSRVAVFRIPGSPLGVEFVEFKGVSQKPVRPDIEDPGASILTLTVPDVESVMARLKLQGGPVIRDPDGFFIELRSDGVTKLNLVVNNTGRTMKLYRDLLGFKPRIAKKFVPDTRFGVPGAKIRISTAKVPGTEFEVDFIEFQGVKRRAIEPAIHDPGAGVLRLIVRDSDSLLRTLKTAGVPVASAGGEPVTIGANRHFVILTDPNYFHFQLAPAPPARPR